MLTHLEIFRFRGIQELILDDFARVNVFVGANGAGKTSVLESISLCSTPTLPNRIINLSQFRDMPNPTLQDDSGLGTLFHRADLFNGPQFNFLNDGVRHQLSIS